MFVVIAVSLTVFGWVAGSFLKASWSESHVSGCHLNSSKPPVSLCIITITAHTPTKCVLKRCVLELQRAVQEDWKWQSQRAQVSQSVSQVLSSGWLIFGWQHSYGHSHTARRDLSLVFVGVQVQNSHNITPSKDYIEWDARAQKKNVSMCWLISIAPTWPGTERHQLIWSDLPQLENFAHFVASVDASKSKSRETQKEEKVPRTHPKHFSSCGLRKKRGEKKKD